MNFEFYLIGITFVLAILHMIAPDHWIPISILSAKRKYNNAKSSGYGFFIGIAHGILSAILALAVAFLGLKLVGYGEVKLASIILLIAVCVYIFINAFKEKENKSSIENTSLLVSFIPDPAFLPIVLAATVYGNLFLGVLSIIFIVAGGVSLMLVVMLARMGFLKSMERVEPVMIDYIVILVLLATALFIFLT